MVTGKRKWILALWFGALTVLLGAGCSLLNPGERGSPPGGTGTIILEVDTDPAGQAGSFTFTGVPTGTLTSESTLVVSDLAPGTYTTTEVDPAPDFDVRAVACDDADSASSSNGDPQTRTAVINLDANETVTCTFTNTRRGTLVIQGITEPPASAGQFTYTGVPTGTIPSNGSLVTSDLPPGTYTSTQVDPAPEFDLTAVQCDDRASRTSSSGDAQTRTAVFNLDPGEMVTCTYVNTRRGTAVVAAVTEPQEVEAELQYTGVPTGTISADGGTLVTSNLSPGTYTTTEVDPTPELDLTAVNCDDGNSATRSGGEAATRSAVFNIDPGETVTCTFVHTTGEAPPGGTGGGSGGSGGSGGAGGGQEDGPGINPFDDPATYLPDFPLQEELPPEAGRAMVPLSGTWTATHLAGAVDCGVNVLEIPPGPPERGTMTVSADGQQIVGEGLEESQSTPVTMSADPDIRGRYTGSYEGLQQGLPVTIDNYWQVVTERSVVGYLTASFSSQGLTCSLYRPYTLEYVD